MHPILNTEGYQCRKWIFRHYKRELPAQFATAEYCNKPVNHAINHLLIPVVILTVIHLQYVETDWLFDHLVEPTVRNLLSNNFPVSQTK